MKICFVSSLHTPFDKRVFDKEARSLAAAGFEVVHVAPGKGLPAFKDGVQLEIFESVPGLKGRISSLRSLYKIGKGVNADVYHCSEVDSWVIGILLKFTCRKKVIFDVHENYPEQFVDTYCPLWTHPLVKFLLRAFFILLIPFTDFFILAKKSIERDFPGTQKKRIVVRNLSYLQYKNKKTEDIKPSITDLYSNKITAVHLGLFSIARGWPQLLEAMAIMKNQEMQSVFIGSLNDGSDNEFEKKMFEFGIEKRVNRISWMPFAVAYDHVLCCQFGLVLFQPVMGHEHAFPHKMFDYMLAGIPIIVPDFAKMVCDIVKETDCGLMVNATSPHEIAEALDYLIDHPEKAKKMGMNGRQAVIEKYNWEKEFKKLFATYQSFRQRASI